MLVGIIAFEAKTADVRLSKTIYPQSADEADYPMSSLNHKILQFRYFKVATQNLKTN
ncbi:hypothetical protein EYZ11_013579 [Aspergillus tanneri]|uniref:Uncharacterized protein n=1 Tax=Aspergillus tanneri TaxID=1220188 RepID=A0A4S3IXK5_9EURO|nr:hypothetical protein EYZ11_013579 [Aspergillus tanneri]